MAENEKDGTKKRAYNRKKENDYKYFLLKSKGYKKQFVNEDAARKSFSKLESKKMAAEENFKIELFGKAAIGDNWVELDFVQINDFD